MAAIGHGDIGIAPRDDVVMPFRTDRSGVAGKVVRLGSAIDRILSSHDYPDAVCEALGHALALTAMLGNPLKQGRLILQTRTNGPLNLLVVNYDAPGHLRGYASFDPAGIAALEAAGELDEAHLLGSGHMAMTIDPGGPQSSHQGIVALDGGSIADAAHTYFRQSEQLPTFIRLAVARHYRGPARGAPGTMHWRAGGLIVQHVPREGGQGGRDLPSGAEADDLLEGEHDENWRRVEILASTVETHELLDPLLAPERLLYRLFHEEGVRVTPVTALKAKCRCSRQRISALLRQFSAAEMADMREADGQVSVTCEFCSTKYRFKPEDLA